MQAAIGAPATAGGGEQRFAAFAFEAQRQLLRRQLFEHRVNGGAAGREQCHLMRLQITKGAADGLFGAELAGFAAAQKGVQGLARIGAVLERVVAGALHGGQRQAQFVLQLAAGAQALLQARHALLEQAGSIQCQRLPLVFIHTPEIDAQCLAEALPEAGWQTFRLRFALGFGCSRWHDQFRQRQAFGVDAGVVALLGLALRCQQCQVEVVDFGVDALLLIHRDQGIEVEEGIVGDDGAGRLWAANVAFEPRRVLDQPGADLEVAQAVDAAMLDALRLAFDQAGATVLELDAVAAGVGEKEGAVAVADHCMTSGEDALAVGDHPIAALCAADHSAGLFEGFGGQQPGHELLGAHHIEDQFHGRVAPCGYLPRFRACGSPSGR